jgi:hypothetical protein
MTLTSTPRFDGQVLAAYLVATGGFEHPISRRPLTQPDCARLDRYLAEHKLAQPKVAGQGCEHKGS